MVIGISGVAGSGKDTFFHLLNQRINCKRVSLADALKEEVNEWTIKHYGIDALTCSREEKNEIRDFLVFHASKKRKISNGRHWVDIANKKISEHNSNNHIVITDIRYNHYENDEVSWLKNELGGILVHVRMYEEIPDSNEGALIRHYSQPANEEEAFHDPEVRKDADYQLDWPKFKDKDNLEELLAPYVDEFTSKVFL